MRDLEDLHSKFCSLGEAALEWPPDIFGFSAYFAKLTGVYTALVTKPAWVTGIATRAIRDGELWRNSLNAQSPAPAAIRRAWGDICAGTGTGVSVLCRRKAFVRSLLYLLACADEACVGIGIADSQEITLFELMSELQLSKSGNLCRDLPADSIRVLPKLHTPRPGLNIRSLSHHLALCSATEVTAEWAKVPLVKGIPQRAAFNILLAPWPLSVDPSSFDSAALESEAPYGYVKYVPNRESSSARVVDWLREKLDSARALGQHIDLVVFPECALGERQWSLCAKLCAQRGIAVIAGVHDSRDGRMGVNTVRFRLPLIYEDIVQHKHHRWLIDEDQIKTYSLGGTLDTQRLWWENIDIRDRKVQFVSVDERLSVCVLICEDLARQDPVAEIVRAVGPNLVIALLMDGPQLNGRWSSRYATALADDPGSSVLTLSSLGMVERSRPDGKPRSRAVASWKDALNDFKAIEVEPGNEAVILNIQFIEREEWTADGRSDGEVASFPVACGTHFV